MRKFVPMYVLVYASVLVDVWHCDGLCRECALVLVRNFKSILCTQSACQSMVYHFESRELSMFASKLESE